MQVTPINKTVYFSGTFDPPHNGHLHAVLSAMLEVNAESAVIWADAQENSHKPNRLPWEMRTEMLKKMFEPFNKVYIGSSWDHVLITLKNAYVVFLIGSDVWPRYSQKAPNRFNKEILVSCRADSPAIDPAYPIPVKLIHPCITDCSSTRVREAFFNLKSLEESSPIIDRSLPKRVQAFIKSRLLYIDHPLRQHILYERTLSMLNESKEWSGSVMQYIPNNQGISGDYVFQLFHQGSSFFGKVFSTHRKALPQNRLVSEVIASDWIRRVNFHFATASQVFKVHYDIDRSWGFAISELCLAKDLNSFFDVNGMKRAFYLTGKALRELHSKVEYQRKQFPPASDIYEERAISCLRECSDIPDSDYYMLIDIIKKAKEKFHENWGIETWTHDDANLGNFMVDLTKEKVWLVDLSTFSLGFPAKDYQHVLAGLHYRQLQCAMPEEAIKQVNRKFREGYDNQGFITKEANRYFKIYWKTRTICSYFKSNNPHLKARAHYLLKLIISKYYKVGN